MEGGGVIMEGERGSNNGESGSNNGGGNNGDLQARTAAESRYQRRHFRLAVISEIVLAEVQISERRAGPEPAG
eukprot:936111-Rhodomonas_salina.4